MKMARFKAIALSVILFVAPLSELSASQQYQFSARGRTYTVTTTAISGSGLSFPNHWLYQPSVIFPSALTGNQYVMLFSSNKTAGVDLQGGVAIFMSTSANGYSGWTTPTILLDGTAVSNICDLAGARPIWNGYQWHIYVQAVGGSIGSCTGPINVVFMASGPSLQPGQIQWVKEAGTNNAKVVLQGSGDGIGEDQQWFNTAAYGGPSTHPLLVTYNNWGYPGAYGGSELFSGLFVPNMSSGGYWAGPIWSPENGAPWFLNIHYYPDALLIDSLDNHVYGPPGLGFQSTCQLSDRRYQYCVGLAYFPNPQSQFPTNGTAYPGPLESTSSDSNGPRMFRPRMARNEYGYIPTALGSGGSARIWKTFLYYNDRQINLNSSDSCHLYSRWNTSDQRFSVSELMIFEQ
jgi:hypothetical protein